MNDNDYTEVEITIPKVLQVLLPRRNIAEIIDNASLDEMIFLVAPYGCGKTMAVLSWLKEYKEKAAWVSLSDKENSVASFWAYLSAAILRFSGRQDNIESILNDSHFAENPRVFFGKVLVQVSSTINDKVLIIDNFNFIQSSGLLREIRDIIGSMLGYWRVIIISRNELPSIFNDFILKRRLCLITLNELSFNLEEMNEYFLMNGLAVEWKDLVQIHKETDGWPAALNVILTVPHNGEIRYNDYAKAYVKDFFQVEVWRQISDETVKTFLMKTSILNELNPAVCHYVTGIEETHLILRNLYTNGIFISKLDKLDSFRYHRVFQDFLLAKLYHSSVDENALYMKVGWWLYERGESVPSLLYFFKAKDLYGINQAFKKVKPADMGMERYLDSTLCLTSLDIMDLKAYPEVAVRIALLHFLTNNISEVRRIYRIVLEWLEPGVLSIPPEEYIDLIWEAGWLRYVNPDEDILFDEKFNEWVNVMEYAPHLVASDRSRAAVLRLPSILRGVRDFSTVIERAEEYYKINNETGHSVVRDILGLFSMDLIEAEISYEREDFHKAEKIIKGIMPNIKREKLSELYFAGTVLLVKISRAVHDPNEIDKLTMRLKTLIETNEHLFLMPNFHAFELRTRLKNGISGMTETFEKENKPYLDKAYYYLIYRHITYVRALLSENKYSEANLFLGNLGLLCHQYKRNMDLIEINILFSIAEYGLKHESDAYHHLKMALDEGRKCGFIRIFSDDAVLLWPILSLLNKSDIDEYIQKIIISCKRTLARAGIKINSSKGLDPLTKKEIEILKLLAAGMSYKEIALYNHIKIGTVRTHIHSIYSKLNVDNKISAILLAQKNGIVENITLPLEY